MRRSLEEAARNLMTNHSISVVVASGNSQEDSCLIAPGKCLFIQMTPMSSKSTASMHSRAKGSPAYPVELPDQHVSEKQLS